MSEKIRDGRFLRLISNMLSAGYLEDWKWNATLSGAPQGGVVSPVLSNIYLHKLDEFVGTVLVPQYTRGEVRRPNPAYQEVRWAWRGLADGGPGRSPEAPPRAAPPTGRGHVRPRLPAAPLFALCG